jgi:hypothetical protein
MHEAPDSATLSIFPIFSFDNLIGELMLAGARYELALGGGIEAEYGRFVHFVILSGVLAEIEQRCALESAWVVRNVYTKQFCTSTKG